MHFSEIFVRRQSLWCGPLVSQPREAPSSLSGASGWRLGSETPLTAVPWEKPLFVKGPGGPDITLDSFYQEIWRRSIVVQFIGHKYTRHLGDVWLGAHSNGFDEVGTWFLSPRRWKVSGMLRNMFSLQQSGLHHQPPSIGDRACVSGTGSEPVTKPARQRQTHQWGCSGLPLFLFLLPKVCAPTSHCFPSISPQWPENNTMSSILSSLWHRCPARLGRLQAKSEFLITHPMVQYIVSDFSPPPPSWAKDENT